MKGEGGSEKGEKARRPSSSPFPLLPSPLLRWLYRQWLRLRRWLRGRRRREIAMKLETVEALAEVRQHAAEKLRESGEWDLDLAALPAAARTPRATPVLDAYEDGTCWRVWCAYCRHWHRHSRGAGHRVAHCSAVESPYRATGYTLRYAGPFTEARRREGR